MPRTAILIGLCLNLLLAALPAVQAPSKAPNYVIQLTTGQKIPLNTHAGKVVFLLFVNTDCPHCGEACKIAQRLQDDYGLRGFQALGIAFDQRARQDLPGFIKRSGARFPIGFDTAVALLNFIQRPPGIVHVPILVVIDRAGYIRGQYFGDHELLAKDPERNLRALAEKLLQESPGRSPKLRF